MRLRFFYSQLSLLKLRRLRAIRWQPVALGRVKLNRPNLTVQTRKGYYALPMLNGEPLQPFEAQALDEINTRPFPSDLPFDAG